MDYLLDMRLREVLLKGNPIEQQGDSYHKYVVKKLRTVELLDQVSVKEWRKEVCAAHPKSVLRPSCHCFTSPTCFCSCFPSCRTRKTAV